MPIYRDFDAEDAQRLAEHGLPRFKMSGVEFTLRDDIPLDVLSFWDEFNAKPDETKPRSQAERIGMITHVWHELVIPADGARFDALLAAPEKPGIMHLIKAAEWAIEVITSRPFEVSSDSPTPSQTAPAEAGSTVPRSLAAVERSASMGSGTG